MNFIKKRSVYAYMFIITIFNFRLYIMALISRNFERERRQKLFS